MGAVATLDQAPGRPKRAVAEVARVPTVQDWPVQSPSQPMKVEPVFAEAVRVVLLCSGVLQKPSKQVMGPDDEVTVPEPSPVVQTLRSPEPEPPTALFPPQERAARTTTRPVTRRNVRRSDFGGPCMRPRGQEPAPRATTRPPVRFKAPSTHSTPAAMNLYGQIRWAREKQASDRLWA
jgi:hypothetical protein